MARSIPSPTPPPAPPTPSAEPALPRGPQPPRRAAPEPRPDPLPTGVDPLDEADPFPPGSLVFAEAATGFLDRLLHGLVCSATARGRETLWVDGADVLDVFDLGRAARARGLDPETTLRSVTVARGFTAYQIHALVEERLPEAATHRTGLVVAAGLPLRYLDEDVASQEAQDLLARALGTLRDVARDHDVPAVATHRGMGALHRSPALRTLLHEVPDDVLRLFPAPGGAVARLPDRDEAVRCPDPDRSQSLLDEWGVA